MVTICNDFGENTINICCFFLPFSSREKNIWYFFWCFAHVLVLLWLLGIIDSCYWSNCSSSDGDFVFIFYQFFLSIQWSAPKSPPAVNVFVVTETQLNHSWLQLHTECVLSLPNLMSRWKTLQRLQSHRSTWFVTCSRLVGSERGTDPNPLFPQASYANWISNQILYCRGVEF